MIDIEPYSEICETESYTEFIKNLINVINNELKLDRYNKLVVLDDTSYKDDKGFIIECKSGIFRYKTQEVYIEIEFTMENSDANIIFKLTDINGKRLKLNIVNLSKISLREQLRCGLKSALEFSKNILKYKVD